MDDKLRVLFEQNNGYLRRGQLPDKESILFRVFGLGIGVYLF